MSRNKMILLLSLMLVIPFNTVSHADLVLKAVDREELIYVICCISLLSLFLMVKLIMLKNIEKNKDIELQEKEIQLKMEGVKFRKKEDEVYTMAYYDNLTGLGNKQSLYHDLGKLCVMEDAFALVFFDLDNLKVVNDSLGYIQGDKLIKKAADRLKCFESEHNCLYRWGGDEFVFICFDKKYQHEMESFAKNIVLSFQEPIEIDGVNFYTTASMGISFYQNQGTAYEEIIKKATAALRYVKMNGKSNYKIHTQELSDLLIEKIKLETDLREAIKNQDFIVYYQPRVNVFNNQIKGMEALVRWRVKGKEIVSPAEFIPLAEKTGLIKEIDYIVIREASRQTKIWNDMGYDINVSVNLSAKQFEDNDMIEILESILQETEIKTSNLKLEITESAVMENIDSAIVMINKMKNMGLKVLLDDFGTGYSSLNYLKRLPLDVLKIDKSFMDKVIDDSKERIITEAVIELAHSLGLSVVAEGVETNTQVLFLKKQNCDEYQGYFFSEPVNKQCFEELLKVQKIA